jgi:molecular chaperone GrpE
MDPNADEPRDEVDADDAPQAPTDICGNSGDGGEGESPELEAPEASLEEQLALAQQKSGENWDLYLRALAEVDNLRRRSERELSQALRFGSERLTRELMPVLDSLELALSEHDADGDPARDGLEMIQRQFLQALDTVGVEAIEPIGEAFDPELHEAMTIQESAEAAPDSVLIVVQRGYRLSERLIRPARVVVAKAPEAAEG